MLMIDKGDFARHHTPASVADRIAAGIVRLMEGAASLFFGRRYGDGAVVLETVAAVPAMVAATLLHLKCLRRMIDDRGWVRAFMDEAESQRAHLMAFVALQQPGPGERLFIAVAQILFYNAFFLLHLVSPRTGHRLTGYLAEAAVRDYSRRIGRLEAGQEENVPAPAFAVGYWNLPHDARLSDMLVAMREDEAIHRDINHAFADALAAGRPLPEREGWQV